MSEEHFWESEWYKGQFVCKTCHLPPKKCNGKITIRGLKNNG